MKKSIVILLFIAQINLLNSYTVYNATKEPLRFTHRFPSGHSNGGNILPHAWRSGGGAAGNLIINSDKTSLSELGLSELELLSPYTIIFITGLSPIADKPSLGKTSMKIIKDTNGSIQKKVEGIQARDSEKHNLEWRKINDELRKLESNFELSQKKIADDELTERIKIIINEINSEKAPGGPSFEEIKSSAESKGDRKS